MVSLYHPNASKDYCCCNCNDSKEDGMSVFMKIDEHSAAKLTRCFSRKKTTHK